MTLHLGERIISFCQTWPGIFRNNVITVQYAYIQKLLYSHLHPTKLKFCDVYVLFHGGTLGKNLFWEAEEGGWGVLGCSFFVK